MPAPFTLRALAMLIAAFGLLSACSDDPESETPKCEEGDVNCDPECEEGDATCDPECEEGDATCDDNVRAPYDPTAYCGNGIVEFYEQCDDGDANGPDADCFDCRNDWERPDGEPLELAGVKQWKYFPFDGALCRSGSQAGINVSLGSDPTKVMVFFEGGGACFEGLNCGANPADASSNPPGARGIFNRNDDRNPYQDWTWVYLPYCSGDVFAGNAPDAKVLRLDGLQQFVGDNNMRLFLDRLVPTLGSEDVEDLSVIGISAGGISAMVQTKRLAREFPNARVTVLDDGGPPLSTTVVKPCLQKFWNELWNLEDTVLADCGAGCQWEDDLLLPMTLDLLRGSDDRIHFGLFSFRTDAVVRLLFTFGENDCRMLPIPLQSESLLEDGLFEFRDIITEVNSDKSSTFYAPGGAHVCVTGDCFYNLVVEGMHVYEWTQNLIDDIPTHIGFRDGENTAE